MPKTNAEYCREYRKKKRGNKVKKVAKSSTERVREFRARQKSILNKKQNIYIAQTNTSTVQNSESDQYPKLSHHMVQHDKTFENNVTPTNIKEEVCHREGNEDIQFHIKSENPQCPIKIEQIKYQINNEHIEIKREVPCEYTDFDDNRDPQLHHMHNKVSEENLININIRQEVCYEEANEDIQVNGNGHLQIKSEYIQFSNSNVRKVYLTNNIHDEMITQNKIDAEKYTIDLANENEKSKLLVPEIKVFNHILEISPIKYTNFDNQHSMSEQDDSRKGLHDVLQHIHNYVSNKFSKEISTNTDTQKAIRYAEKNEDIKVNINEQIQVKTERTRDSLFEEEESKNFAPQSTANNVYDHVLEIKQETLCAYTYFDGNQSIVSNVRNIDTNVQEGFRIKCEENQNPNSQLIEPSADMSSEHDRQRSDSNQEKVF